MTKSTLVLASILVFSLHVSHSQNPCPAQACVLPSLLSPITCDLNDFSSKACALYQRLTNLQNDWTTLMQKTNATKAGVAPLWALVNATEAQVQQASATETSTQNSANTIQGQVNTLETNVNNLKSATDSTQTQVNNLVVAQTATQAQVDQIQAQETATQAQLSTLQSGENAAQVLADGALAQQTANQNAVNSLATEQSTNEAALSAYEAHLAALQLQVNAIPLTASVPQGYIYVQLPNEPAPSSLWPNYNWLDVTSNYAGQFFRAAGGSAAAFGTTQPNSAPYIGSIGFYKDAGANSRTVQNGFTPIMINFGNTPNSCANMYVTGQGYGVEVRPVNTAVTIWKRQ